MNSLDLDLKIVTGNFLMDLDLDLKFVFFFCFCFFVFDSSNDVHFKIFL